MNEGKANRLAGAMVDRADPARGLFNQAVPLGKVTRMETTSNVMEYLKAILEELRAIRKLVEAGTRPSTVVRVVDRDPYPSIVPPPVGSPPPFPPPPGHRGMVSPFSPPGPPGPPVPTSIGSESGIGEPSDDRTRLKRKLDSVRDP